MKTPILSPDASCEDCPVLAYANEIPVKQLPHFPCGPCPVSATILKFIKRYEREVDALRKVLVETCDDKQVAIRREAIFRIDIFMDHLWTLYALAEAVLTASDIEETP